MVELVNDRENKTPIDKDTITNIQKAVYKAGVMIRVSGPNIILSPPLIINKQDTAKVVEALDEGFASV